MNDLVNEIELSQIDSLRNDDEKVEMLSFDYSDEELKEWEEKQSGMWQLKDSLVKKMGL